jgi:hypothetical protein
MGADYYRFDHVWRIGAPVQQVFDTLADIRGYPDWWPQVLTVRALDEDHADVTIRSALPKTLHLVLGDMDVEPGTGVLDVSITGDMTGYARWYVVRAGRVTEATYLQEVHVGERALRAMSLLIRPILRFNHNVMMRAGERGLAAHLHAPIAR